jgi:hypothetical protein
MSKREFAEVMNFLYIAYGRERDKPQMRVYYGQLSMFNLNSLRGAAEEWVRESPFFPKVADLIKLIKDEEITIDGVLMNINYVISISTGRSWKKEYIHPVSYQILKELGGKHRVASMSENELQKQIHKKYKYVVNERILGLAHDDKPQIGDRDGKTESMNMIIDKGLKLDSQEPKESSDMGELNPSKIRII